MRRQKILNRNDVDLHYRYLSDIMFIPGEIIALLTFPGVIVHELAHKYSCVMADVHVYEVCYFRFGNPAGYVKHEPVHGYGRAFLINVAPFVANSLIAFDIFLFASRIPGGSLYYNFLLWLGISVGMHAFPSNEDADNLWNYSRRAWRIKPWALIGFPIVVLIEMSNALSFFWFDLFYAIGLFMLAGGKLII